MTREYFLDCVTDWSELLELCSDYGSDVCEDIVDYDILDDYIQSDIESAIRSGMTWREIRDNLDDIDTDYGYYRVDGSFDYEGMDNGEDFDEYKERMLEWMDDGEYWDDEDGDDYDPEEDFTPGEDEPSEPAVEDEDFSVSDLMNMCGAELVTIQKIDERRRKEEDDNMVRLLAV